MLNPHYFFAGLWLFQMPGQSPHGQQLGYTQGRIATLRMLCLLFLPFDHVDHIHLSFSPSLSHQLFLLFCFFIFVYSFTTSGKPKILLKISSEWIKATLLWLSSGTNHT